MTTDTEALRAKFEKLLSDSGRACLYEGDGHYAYPHDFSWLCYRAGHAAAKAEIATAGAPMAMAMVQCHGSAEHPLYTADQLAAAVAEERGRCLDIIETYRIPVGNSAAGEMACEWTYDALQTIRDAIRAEPKEPSDG